MRYVSRVELKFSLSRVKFIKGDFEVRILLIAHKIHQYHFFINRDCSFYFRFQM